MNKEFPNPDEMAKLIDEQEQEKLCPKCGAELFADSKAIVDGLIYEFLFCETCQISYDENLKVIVWIAGHFEEI